MSLVYYCIGIVTEFLKLYMCYAFSNYKILLRHSLYSKMHNEKYVSLTLYIPLPFSVFFVSITFCCSVFPPTIDLLSLSLSFFSPCSCISLRLTSSSIYLLYLLTYILTMSMFKFNDGSSIGYLFFLFYDVSFLFA